MLIGMFDSSSCESELSVAVDAVSMVDAFATTSTVSATPPTLSVNGTVERPADADVEIALRARREAGQFDLDLVRPRIEADEAILPLLVGDGRPAHRVRPVSVTVTPGSTPPCSSATLPAMVPVRDWALAAAASNEEEQRHEHC